MPYALDNDAFSAWKSGQAWDESAWKKLLAKAAAQPQGPMWALVPDVVANREATLANWNKYRGVVADYGWPLAFAVQDGMESGDVPREASVVFVGGSTRWKWRTARQWCANFPRVHIGRVRVRKLQLAEEMGAESIDGTGFMRETFYGKPARQLKAFIEGYRDRTLNLFPM
jgi:hypothetical protein